jgi:equilibrative nucleoside transporter 1/2/3
MIFYLLGIGSLLPWNFFSNAKQYFMYKLRNTSLDNDSSWTDPKQFNESQIMFLNYLELAALVPSIVFMFLNMALTKMISVRIRIVVAMTVMIVMFTLTVTLTHIDTDKWQYEFLILSLLSIVFMNASSAVLQGAVCGLAGLFPEKYMQAVMGGMGLGGLMAAAVNVLTTAVLSSPIMNGLTYFLAAEFVIIAGLMCFLTLYKLSFVQFYVNDQTQREEILNNSMDSASSVEYTVIVPHIKLWQRRPIVIIRQIWIEEFVVLLTFFVTLACYPAVNSSILSTLQKTPFNSQWINVYFVPVTCFLLFNLWDLIGRSSTSCLPWPNTTLGMRVLVVVCLLRIAFIPLFLLCNIQPRFHLPVLIQNDYVPIIAICLFGLSNGYLVTTCMIIAPKRVDNEDIEMTGSVMSFFMSVGLGLGALLSIALMHLV